MQIFIVIGARGTGKSTLIEQRVKNVPRERLHIYDIEKRYFKNEPLPDIEDFMITTSNAENSVIVYEEATIFFPNRGNNKELRMTLVKSRYKNNVAFLVYHSICAVPYYVYELADCVILFNTKDEEERVLKKYKMLHKFWWVIKNHEHANKLKPGTVPYFKLLNGKLSPYKIVKL